MGAVDQELTQDQAIRVLLACRELFIDEELQENLAGLDAQCGGVMASWQPPWVEEGIEEMNFDEKMLRQKPVEIWVADFERVLQKLSRAAEQAELVSPKPAFVVVIPGGLDGLPVLQTLVRLGGGTTLNEGSTSTLPFSRFIFLKSLEGWSPFPGPGPGSGLPWADFVDAKLDPDGYRREQHDNEETLRSRALMAVLNATPAPATLAPKHQCAEDKVTQNESVSSAPVAGGMLKPTCLPSSIKFLHLGILQVATKSHSEAAGLILAVMQLLREEEIWAKLIALDAYCDSLLSNWQPPWEEGSTEPGEPMNLERLRQEDESTVYDWAMALDGFCSFVANLAVAARIHHQVSSSGEVTATAPPAEVEDPDLEQSPTFEATGSGAAVTARCSVAVALVVVVPDELTEWHLEVFGPLLRAFKIFMLSEKAWRRDFNAASSVPFSVEATSVLGVVRTG